jgi:large subunit ribosomal protein L24
VQTTLLGVAIAIILAFVTALVAPLVVDWSYYRSAFEEEASRLTGLTVHVNGAIDARILPSPHVKLRDVEVVGAGGGEPNVRAGAVELEVGLGPLIRGEVRATEVSLLAPQIRLGLDRSGALDWPRPAASIDADALTVSRLKVENGRVTFADAGSGSGLVLNQVSFNGDIRSFLGPFSGDGSFVAGGEAYAFRISGNRVGEDGRVKLKLGVDPASHPLTTEIDGSLGFDRGVPQFDGTLALARPVGATLAGGARVMSNPWQLAGKISATPASAALEELAFQYGPEERAAVFSGKAEVKFGAHPHLDGEISAHQVDVDRVLAEPDVTHRPPLVMLKSFLEEFVATVRPPVPVTAGVTIEAVTVGGATIQALHGRVRFDDRNGWGLDDFALRAPGFTAVSLSGRLGASAQGFKLSGPASVESADLKTLVAWLEGRDDHPSGAAQSMTARGDVTIANDRLVLDRLSASLDQEKVEGRLAYIWAAGDRPAALDGELRAAKLDIDALTAFAKAAASDGAFEVPREIALVLDIGKATFAGVDARAVNARLKLNAGILHIDRLSIGDLSGAALDISGRIDELSSQPRGQLTLDVSASTLAGLATIAGRYAPDVPNSFSPFADRLAPAKMHGVLTIDRPGKAGGNASSVAKLEIGGTLGALRLTLNGEATGVPAHFDAALVRVTGRFDADDGAALVRLLDLDRILAVDQLPGQMTISAHGPLNGDIRVSGLAAAGGFSAAAEGMVHLHGEAPSGSLQIRATAADLRPLYRLMTGQANAAVPVSLSAIVGIAGPDLSVTDLALTSGKSSARGRLDLKVASPITVAGEVAADEVDAATVAALLFGLPSAVPGAGKPWSPSPVGPGAFGAVNGAVGFKFDRAALTPSLTARDLKGVVRFAPPEIALNDLDGKLAGGRLSGGLTFRHDPQSSIAAHGYVELANANAAAFVSSGAIDGSISAKLQGESQGLSPDGVIGAFHGGGTITLTRAQFAGLNPAAFDAAIRQADQSGTIDAAKVRAVVSATMDSGKLAVPKGDAEVTIAGGQIRLTNATVAAQGGAELLLDGVLDLNNATIDAKMTLSGQPAANALIPLRPELSVSVRGPLTAPERRLDVAALIGWLTMRATEQQTRRLESLEANRRADVLGDFVRPPPPSLRFVPRGTALEINNHTAAAASLPPGTNGLDRLRADIPNAAIASPPLPPLPPSSPPAVLSSPGPSKPLVPNAAPGADKPTANAGTAPAASPQQSLRSLLNSLFGSQN